MSSMTSRHIPRFRGRGRNTDGAREAEASGHRRSFPGEADGRYDTAAHGELRGDVGADHVGGDVLRVVGGGAGLPPVGAATGPIGKLSRMLPVSVMNPPPVATSPASHETVAVIIWGPLFL